MRDPSFQLDFDEHKLVRVGVHHVVLHPKIPRVRLPGRKVLVLEQHSVAGGLTQTFSREGFTWNVGMHYLGEMEPGGAVRKVIDWLSDGKILFSSMGAVYNTLHFPDGFEFQMSRPETALKRDLKEIFPASGTEIDPFLEALAKAQRDEQTGFLKRFHCNGQGCPGLGSRTQD